MKEVTDTETTGTFKVYRQQNVVVCEYEGDLTEELLDDSIDQIQVSTKKGSKTLGIILDTMKMRPLDLDMAKKMQNMQEEFLDMAPKVGTVTVDASLAYKSKRAFKDNDNHRVFYNDRGGATRWMLTQ
jgi:hypothetical protein